MRINSVLVMLFPTLTLLAGCTGTESTEQADNEEEESIGEAQQEWNVAQLVFNPGYTKDYKSVKHYRSVNRLVVTGYNQNNQIVTWSGTFPWTTLKSIPNWWWDFDRSVYLQFDLRDESGLTYYPNRSCTAYKPAWQGSVSSVRFLGDGQCQTM